MEKNEINGLLSGNCLHYLLEEAARSDRQMVRLARRLDNLEKHCSDTANQTEAEVYRIKKRMYSVGISYYATRADYCYRKAELEFRRQEKQSIQNPKQFWKYWEIKQQSIKYTDYEQGNELGHIRSDKGNQRV